MNNVNYDRLSQVIGELFHNTPDYVHAIGYAHKYVSGTNTNEGSIVFDVLKKLPKDQVPQDELIPSEINIDGNIYKTDVVECEPIKYAASCYGWTTAQYRGITNITGIDNLRRTVRPLKGGVSIANIGGTWATYGANGVPAEYPDTGIASYGYGTMGAIVVDNEDNSLVGLTNAHVVVGRDAQEYFSTAFRTDNNRRIGAKATGAPQTAPNLASRTYNILDDTYYIQYTLGERKLEQGIRQPGEDIDYGNVFGNLIYNSNGQFPNAHIGQVKRFTPIIYTGTDPTTYSFSGTNVDGALISLKQSELDEAQSWKFAGFESLFTKPLPFATTAQINAITIGSNVWSVGRTTGPKGSGICTPVVINSVNKVAFVSTNYAYYRDLTYYQYQDASTYPLYEGDSGSVAIMNFGTNAAPDYRIVGLCFAYSSAVGVFCRIDNVAAQLNISAFTGSGYNDSSITNISRWVSGSSSSGISGKFCGANSGNYYLAGQVHTDPAEATSWNGTTMGYNIFTMADGTPYQIISGTGTANNCKQY